MKKLFITLTILGFACSARAADNSATDFAKANGLYAKQQFEQAVVVYGNLIALGQADASVYYNLGNSYYKIQKYGRAMLNYEKALRLKPRDPDIRFNAGFLRSIVKEPQESFPESAITALNGTISLNELTLLCSGLYFLLIAAIIFYMISKRQKALLLSIVCAASVVIITGWLLIKIDKEVLSREAIVVSGPADVRNGPGEENSVGFTLPEGRAVMILGTKDNWTAIGLKTEGLRGWIEKKYLEEI